MRVCENGPARSGNGRLVALLCAALASGVSGVGAAEQATLEPGAPAPDFSLPGVDGRDYSLKDFEAAEVLVVVFTANHCPTAQSYEERIVRLHEDFESRGVALVAVSPNDPKAVRLDELGYTDLGDTLEEMKIRAEHVGFDFPYLYDGETQAMSRAYGPVATPHVFIFDRERRLRYVGRVDDSEEGVGPDTIHSARDALEEVLAGREVSIPKTKTFGCSIKWSDKRADARRAQEQWEAREVDLEMIDASGVSALVANASKKLRLINVWATWCGPCAAEFPELVKLHQSYGHRGFELVSISGDSPSDRPAVHEFLKQKHAATANYLFDSDDQYALIEAVDESWQGALPYSMLIGAGGEVLYRYQGSLDMLELKREIVKVLGRKKDW